MLLSLLSLKGSSVLINLRVVLSFKGFERNELAGTESSWFVWFKTEYELAKFERGLLEAWQELFQVCMSVHVNRPVPCFTKLLSWVEMRLLCCINLKGIF